MLSYCIDMHCANTGWQRHIVFGPWQSLKHACRFATSEVGVPWVVTEHEHHDAPMRRECPPLWSEGGQLIKYPTDSGIAKVYGVGRVGRSMFFAPLPSSECDKLSYSLETHACDVLSVTEHDTGHGALGWQHSNEGPWETLEQSLQFANAEVGVPWVIVEHAQYKSSPTDSSPYNLGGTRSGAVVYGDRQGVRGFCCEDTRYDCGYGKRYDQGEEVAQ